MDALEIIRVLLRRWVLSLCLALLLGVGLTAVMFSVPQQHRATAMVLVIHQANKEIANPYGAVDKAQGQAASLVVRVLSGSRTQAELVKQGATAHMEISNEGGSVDPDSPFITLEITGASRAEVLRTGQVVLERAREELRNRQDGAGVAASEQMIITDVIPVDATTTTRAAQLRAVGLFGALGLLLSVMIVVIHDQRRLRAQRHRRARRVAAVPPAEDVDKPSSPERSEQPERERVAVAHNKATYQRIGRPIPPPPMPSIQLGASTPGQRGGRTP